MEPLQNNGSTGRARRSSCSSANRNVYITVTPSEDKGPRDHNGPPPDGPSDSPSLNFPRGRRSSASHYSGSQTTTAAAKAHNYSGSTHRHSSILSGIRELMGRPRSESMGNAVDRRKLLRSPVNKKLVRVQIESCPVESVYDLREEDENNGTDFYNDSFAFRRPRSNSSDFLILRKTSRPLSVEVVGLVDDYSDPYKQYMSVVDCYELAPHSGSIVILDKHLKLEKAFRTLTNCGIGAALVWSEQEQRVISIVTLTDFLILLLDNKTPDPPDLVQAAISKNQLVTLNASKKLLFACEEFCLNRIHRIAVVEPNGDVLYFLTIKRILQAIHKQNRSLHFALWLSCEIKTAAIGTWQNLKSVKMDDSLKTTAKLMLDYRISSIPVVDDQFRPIDVICKADIANALSETKDIKTSFEELTISDTIRQAEARTGGYRNRPRFLYETDSMGCALDAILSQKNCRCLFIKSVENDQLKAAISLSDIISYILDDSTARRKLQHQQHQKLLHPLRASTTVGQHNGGTTAVTNRLEKAKIFGAQLDGVSANVRTFDQKPVLAAGNKEELRAVARSSSSSSNRTSVEEIRTSGTGTSHSATKTATSQWNGRCPQNPSYPASTADAEPYSSTTFVHHSQVPAQAQAQTSGTSRSFQAPEANYSGTANNSTTTTTKPYGSEATGSVPLPHHNGTMNNVTDNRSGRSPQPKLIGENLTQRDGPRVEEPSGNSNTSNYGHTITDTGNINNTTQTTGISKPNCLHITSRDSTSISDTSAGTSQQCSNGKLIPPTTITIQSLNGLGASLQPGKTAPAGKTGKIIPAQNPTRANDSSTPLFDESSVDSIPLKRLVITNR